MFLETRSNGVHYLAVKQSWEKFISDPDQSVEVQVEICPVSLDVLLQQILQHFWFTRSNRYGHGIGTEDTNPSNVDCASASTSINDEDLSEDNDSIRDHAGWAIKRARDVIFKGQHELPAKESVGEESQVIYASKSDALSIISLLGEDRKQPDESNRFYVYEHVVPFFIFLHIFVENLLSPINIVREKGNILKYCLDQMSVNKELRDRWNELTPNSDMRASVVVLHRVVTFFIKSKQQIFREKEGLKPNKKSVALRQQIRRPEQKCSAVSPGPTQTNEHVETLRRNFTSSGLNVFLVHLQTLAQSEQEHTLKNLQGKEIAKILKALGQPAFMGKRKEKQINTLLGAVKGGLVCAKFPDEVCI
jgi:hypothetical protein